MTPENEKSAAMEEDNVDSVFEDDDMSITMGSEFGCSDPDSKDTKNKNKTEQERIAQTESRVVALVRFLVVFLLIGVTAGVAAGVYFFVRNSETESFEDEFKDSSDKLFDAVGSVLDQSLGATDNLMISLVSHQEATNSSWPFVTIPHFAVRSAKILQLGRVSVIGVHPLVSHAKRQEWEDYSVANDGWVEDSLKIQAGNSYFKGTNIASSEPAPHIYNRDGASGPEEKYYPTWQSAPVVPRPRGYNRDFYPSYASEIDEVQSRRVVAMGRTLNLPTPGNEAELAIQNQTIRWISELVGPDQNPDEPLLIFYYPIVANATDAVSVSEEEDPSSHPVVGVITVTIFWRKLIEDILSPGSEGLVVVIGNTCGQKFSYQINGPSVEYLGFGDQHDPKYDHMERSSFLYDLGRFSSHSREYSGFPLSTDYCPYWMRAYPSDTMNDQHETNNPLIFCLVAVCIFVFTAVSFLVYDCVSERRQKKVLQIALQSTAVVSSLFPQVVRDKIFPGNQEKKKSNPKERIETAKLRLQQFLRNDEDDIVAESPPSKGDVPDVNNVPIAELFSETTVMFCDIAGFTAWSSVREPAQVFTLLETLYGAYDRLASRRGVFKVETIGDSYMAVTGLPEPRADHAVAMTKFARDIRERTAILVKQLGRTLGPDTDNLEVRIGLNSGPVTAGVLRGERSRFQLFGDTVNTAARMESTGMSSKIHVSQSTASLLRQAGKMHWVTKREGEVEAKGKGRIQTYWAEPTGHQQSSASAESKDDDFQVIDEKTRRLIEWNVEIADKLLGQIVSRREAQDAMNRNSKRTSAFSRSSHGAATGETIQSGTVLDEVKEIIMLPEYDPALARSARGLANQKLSEHVVAQLREFITLIAGMYKSNNPFHNFEHASHVTMSVVKLLSRIVAPSDAVVKTAEETRGHLESTLHDHTYGITSDPLTQFACVFSALIHDVDHPGIPNSQLIKENSPLAAIYKGKSLAEQNSVDISWRLLMEDQFQDLRDIIWSSKSEMARFRQLVVNGVMATDIMDKDLKNLRNARWDKAFSEGSRLGESVAVNTNRKATIVIEHLIQASDVAHTMQHWHIFRKWNERLFAEMYAAYREGRAERNPAEFWYKGEIGFFDFYIIPLAKKLSDCGVFGVSSDEYLSYAMKNREEWENRGQEVVAAMIAKFEVPDKLLGSDDKEEMAEVDDAGETEAGTNSDPRQPSEA